LLLPALQLLLLCIVLLLVVYDVASLLAKTLEESA